MSSAALQIHTSVLCVLSTFVYKCDTAALITIRWVECEGVCRMFAMKTRLAYLSLWPGILPVPWVHVSWNWAGTRARKTRSDLRTKHSAFRDQAERGADSFY